MVKSVLVVAMVALLLGAAAEAPVENAHVPPHAPGTVCSTPKFWCWVQPPGQPGATCFCPSPYGPVKGTYG
jgi:hypothetical protein